MNCLHTQSYRPCLLAPLQLRRLHSSRAFRSPQSSPCKTQIRAASDPDVQPEASTSGDSRTQNKDLNKEVSKFARDAATTFAPRASGPSKNPAFKGSTLYKIFEAQAWIGLVVGGFLSFNILFPSERPDIPRLMGMWSIWMFTIPSLRARECDAQEKDALNLLFLLVPLINVVLPFVWKSFPFIYTADCVALTGVYFWKGIWKLPQSAQ